MYVCRHGSCEEPAAHGSTTLSKAAHLRTRCYVPNRLQEKAALQDVFKRKGPGGGGAGGFQLPPPDPSQAAPWAADASAVEQAWAAAQQWQQPAAAPAAVPGADYYDFQQQGAAGPGAYGYDQQQQEAWDGAAAGGFYQAAEYEAPPGDQAAAGADYGYGYPSSSGSAGVQPSELAFPATYSEPGAPPAADGSSAGGAGGWGGAYDAQDLGGGGGGAAYDGMDDW